MIYLLRRLQENILDVTEIEENIFQVKNWLPLMVTLNRNCTFSKISAYMMSLPAEKYLIMR